MENKNFRIIIAGEGGQGIQKLGKAFAEAAFLAGLEIAYMPNYGVEQRGGVSVGFLQLGKEQIGFPKFSTADIVVVLCARAIERTRQYIGADTLYIYDSSQIRGEELKEIAAEKLAIPATKVASQKLTPRVFNMIMAGAIVQEIDCLSCRNLEDALEVVFKEKYKKKPELRNLNQRAIQLGAKLAKEAYVTN